MSQKYRFDPTNMYLACSISINHCGAGKCHVYVPIRIKTIVATVSHYLSQIIIIKIFLEISLLSQTVKSNKRKDVWPSSHPQRG